MKIKQVIQAVLMAGIFFLYTAIAWASPSLETIDGAMSDSEWSGHQAVGYGNSHGEAYDVEKLGLYINENMLYFGIQTDFHLDGGWASTENKYRYDEYGIKQKKNNSHVDPGDFAFDFNGDGTYEAGIDFQISDGNVFFTFFKMDTPGNWVNPVDHLQNSPYTAFLENYKTSQKSGTGNGEFEAVISYFDDNDRSPGDVLEAAINLDTLSGELNQLFQGSNKTLNLYWTMECGNDALLVSESYSYTPGSQVPEPTTLLLVGIGLLGLGALKRKK